MNAINNNKWIKGIDSLRFILALIVLLSHLSNPIALYLKSSTYLPIKVVGVLLSNIFSGPSAVMAFFIISGFVVHYPVKNKPLNARRFILRRWLRVGLPLAVIGTVAALYSDYGAIPVWSLYCELIYYALYPLLVRLKLSWLKLIIISYAVSILLLLTLGSNDLMSFIYQKNINYRGLYWQLGDYLTWLMGLPVWLLGVWLADNIDTLSLKKQFTSFRFLVFSRFVLLGLSSIIEVARFHAFLSNLVALNFFSIIILFWLLLEIQYYKNRPVFNWLEFCGKFSYSLYLSHIIIIQFLESIIPLNKGTYFIFIGISLLISYGIYLIVEKPSQELARRLFQ